MYQPCVSLGLPPSLNSLVLYAYYVRIVLQYWCLNPLFYHILVIIVNLTQGCCYKDLKPLE